MEVLAALKNSILALNQMIAGREYLSGEDMIMITKSVVPKCVLEFLPFLDSLRQQIVLMEDLPPKFKSNEQESLSDLRTKSLENYLEQSSIRRAFNRKEDEGYPWTNDEDFTIHMSHFFCDRPWQDQPLLRSELTKREIADEKLSNEILVLENALTPFIRQASIYKAWFLDLFGRTAEVPVD
jgi:hypothetical protein